MDGWDAAWSGDWGGWSRKDDGAASHDQNQEPPHERFFSVTFSYDYGHSFKHDANVYKNDRHYILQQFKELKADGDHVAFDVTQDGRWYDFTVKLEGWSGLLTDARYKEFTITLPKTDGEAARGGVEVREIPPEEMDAEEIEGKWAAFRGSHHEDELAAEFAEGYAGAAEDSGGHGKDSADRTKFWTADTLADASKELTRIVDAFEGELLKHEPLWTLSQTLLNRKKQRLSELYAPSLPFLSKDYEKLKRELFPGSPPYRHANLLLARSDRCRDLRNRRQAEIFASYHHILKKLQNPGGKGKKNKGKGKKGKGPNPWHDEEISDDTLISVSFPRTVETPEEMKDAAVADLEWLAGSAPVKVSLAGSRLQLRFGDKQTVEKVLQFGEIPCPGRCYESIVLAPAVVPRGAAASKSYDKGKTGGAKQGSASSFGGDSWKGRSGKGERADTDAGATVPAHEVNWVRGTVPVAVEDVDKAVFLHFPRDYKEHHSSHSDSQTLEEDHELVLTELVGYVGPDALREYRACKKGKHGVVIFASDQAARDAVKYGSVGLPQRRGTVLLRSYDPQHGRKTAAQNVWERVGASASSSGTAASRPSPFVPEHESGNMLSAWGADLPSAAAEPAAKRRKLEVEAQPKDAPPATSSAVSSSSSRPNPNVVARHESAGKLENRKAASHGADRLKPQLQKANAPPAAAPAAHASNAVANELAAEIRTLVELKIESAKSQCIAQCIAIVAGQRREALIASVIQKKMPGEAAVLPALHQYANTLLENMMVLGNKLAAEPDRADLETDRKGLAKKYESTVQVAHMVTALRANAKGNSK